MIKLIPLVVVALSMGSASAAEISHLMLTGKSSGLTGGLIVIKGDIQRGDAQVFNRIAQQYNKAAVLLISNGGNLLAGIEIGRIIRMRNFGTGVAPETLCASACAMAWLGGSVRYMSAKSRLGFHAAYVIQDGVARETGLGNAIVGAYVTQLGLPMSAVVYVTARGPHEMAWLSAKDARRVGIDVEILEIQPDVRVARPSSEDLRSTEPTSAPSPKSDQISPLAGDARWLIVASRAELSDAIAEARKYKDRFAGTIVLQSSNGKYAVATGRYSVEESKQALIELKSSGTIPQDSYVSKGTGLVAIVWR